MRFFIIIVIVSFLSSEDLYSKFKLNPKNSKIIWRANKASGDFHNGFINLNDGYIIMKDAPLEKEIEIQGGEMVIDMTSITCHDIVDENSNQSLVNHLKNNDFFAVADFPTAHLTILQAQEQGDEGSGEFLIKANLTILEETHPIEFLALCNFWNYKSGSFIEGFQAEGVIPINRAIYGVKYKSKTWYKNLGDYFIDDIFYLYFNITTHM